MKVLKIILLLLAPFFTSAETSLWQVTKGDSTLYLGGTIHALRAGDYPLPSSFKKAFEQSSLLVFETDIEQMNSLAFAGKMLTKLNYQDQTTLHSLLSAQTYTQLQQLVERYGLSLNLLEKAKPGLLLATLLQLELIKLGATSPGVDLHFFRLATQANKPTHFFETAEQQLDYLARLGIGSEEKFIQAMLSEIENNQKLFIKMLEYWRSGNSEALNKLVVENMQANPLLYQSLLIERNQRWFPQIEKLFATQETELVLVGVAHLVGKNGLIQLLREKGFQVTQL